MKRILIVDDDADSRYALGLQLGPGYEVVEAADGEAALAEAQRAAPHCILLDVNMPGMDGHEVCRRLRAEPKTRSVPVILVTAHSRGTPSVVEGLAAGADEFVAKPVDQQELRARVHAMLRIRDLQERLESLNLDLEGQVRQRTEELNRVYDTVPVGIYTLDESGRVTSFNRYLESLLGYAAAEVIGKNVGALFAEGYDAAYWLELVREEGRAQGEAMARHKDGHAVPAYDDRVASDGDDGGSAGFVGYLQDVTARRRLERIAKQQETQAAVGRLAASIVHEIANPVSGVAHYLDAVLTRLDRGEVIASDELQRGASVMRDALERTNELIRNLRGFTRSAVRPVAAIDMFVLLSDVRALMRHGLHRRGVEMTVEGGAGVSVHGDAGKLSQVLLNLITNARDAMPDGGAIRAWTGTDGDVVEIGVEDEGVGIPPENLGRVFDFLFTTKGEKGTGFGLALSREIVEEHRGTISVQSRPGEGSCFVIRLPVAGSASGLQGSDV